MKPWRNYNNRGELTYLLTYYLITARPYDPLRVGTHL